MLKLEKYGKSNLDHLRRLKAISVDDVVELWTPDTMPLPAGSAGSYREQLNLPAGCLLLNPSAEWIEPGALSGHPTLQLAINPNGSVNITVTAEQPGDWETLSYAARRLNTENWILVTEDMNRVSRLIGTKEHPASCTAAFNSTSRSWVLTWTATLPTLPYYLPGYKTEILTGDGAGFDTSFNFSFDS